MMYVDREDESEDEKVSPLESNVCATDFLATSLLLAYSGEP